MFKTGHYCPSGDAGSGKQAEKADESEGLMDLRLAFFFADDARESSDNQ